MLAQIKETSSTGIHVLTTTTPTKRKQNFDSEIKDKNTINNGNSIKLNKWNHNPIEQEQQNNSLGFIDNNNITRLEELSTPITFEPWNAVEPADNISKLQAITVPDDDSTWQSTGGTPNNLNNLNNNTNSNSGNSRSFLTTALLNPDDIDDDFDDDYEEDDENITNYGSLKYQCLSQKSSCYSSVQGYIKASLYSEPFLQQQQNESKVSTTTPATAANPLFKMTNFSWINTNNNNNNSNSNNYCIPNNEINSSSSSLLSSSSYSQHHQQTIRHAENGKSYLDLGSSTFNNDPVDVKRPKKCCDDIGGSIWCNGRNCYKEIRLRVRNISMFKLSRFRQISEQSLYRSVLICNTLKQIEKEIDLDNRELCNKMNSQFSLSSQTTTTAATAAMNVAKPLETFNVTQQQLEQQQSMLNNSINVTANNNKDYNKISDQQKQQQSITTPHNHHHNQQSSCINNDLLCSYDSYTFSNSQNGRATPFPISCCNTTDTDSGYGDDEVSRSINWSSVLNLSSQSALDPLNNNEFFTTTTSSTTTLSSSSSSLNNNLNGISTNFSIPTTTAPTAPTNNSSSSPAINNNNNNESMATLEYGFLDMDLGIGHGITELLPNCKITSNDIIKTISSSLSAKFRNDNELESSPTHIMVGS